MINQATNLGPSEVKATYFKGLSSGHLQEIDRLISDHHAFPVKRWDTTPPPGADRTFGLLPTVEPDLKLGCFVFDSRLNDIRYVNKFFEAVNLRLRKGGIFMGRVETSGQRRARQMANYVTPVNFVYCSIDYAVFRVWPKLPKARKLYFWITKGRNRVLSRIETFGRLYSCGFKLLHSFSYDGQMYFIAKKTKDPDFNFDPTYGPIIRLRRVGQYGKPLVVYKLRTMYPYSEYLQEYFYERRGLQKGGKLYKDPRVNEVGRFLRKYWLDEIPMLINLFKGDCKLFGVRPISNHYFSLYPKEFQEYRKKFKPGLIPPLYAEVPKDLDDVIRMERKYLEAYEKSPFRTDLRYFFSLVYGVFFRKVRSY